MAGHRVGAGLNTQTTVLPRVTPARAQSIDNHSVRNGIEREFVAVEQPKSNVARAAPSFDCWTVFLACDWTELMLDPTRAREPTSYREHGLEL